MLSEVFVFKQQTADEMRISDWSSDVCSSDLGFAVPVRCEQPRREPESAPAGIDQGHRNHRQGGQDPEKGNDDKRDTVNRAESVGLHFRIGSSLAEQRAWVAKARASPPPDATKKRQHVYLLSLGN